MKQKPILSILCLLFILSLGWLTACSSPVKEATTSSTKAPGSYHVVGIGPGDVDLLTVRARSLIQKADVVFCRDKTKESLSFVIDFKGKTVVDGFNVLFRYYGRDCGDVRDTDNNPPHKMNCEEYHVKQAEFASRVRSHVNQGKNVVLLSGGDPTIYGPDIWSLRELSDLNPSLVPGLSSFNAANAALKVSLGEVILTAPFKGDGKDSLEKLVTYDKATVIIFMPRDMKALLQRLSSSCAPDTPMAVVRHAGYKDRENAIVGTVGDMEQRLEGEDTHMALVYVGKSLAHAQVVKTPAAPSHTRGTFYLVGAGPGDSDLMTLRGHQVIQEADLIFAGTKIRERFQTELAGKEVIEGYHRLFPFYGEECGNVDPKRKTRERMSCEEYHHKQSELSSMVRAALSQGKTVAMMDSGDPLIYGPCSWTLREFSDLNTRVVPGLSCFNAANAALAQGVTEGENSHSVVLASGWTVDEMSSLQSTMVLFTMRTEFETFIDALSRHYPAGTPIAIVSSAGYAAKEKVIRSSLGTIMNSSEKGKLPFEYLLYVGDFLNGNPKG